MELIIAILSGISLSLGGYFLGRVIGIRLIAWIKTRPEVEARLRAILLGKSKEA
jgi:hypothetical protein